jgi:hypothetical protein
MKELIIKIDDPGARAWDGSAKVFEINRLVRCKACGDFREDGYCERWHISVKPEFFCADGDDGNLQEGT